MSDTTVKYATRARRQPSLIGKDASGRKIPGGPYTLYQPLIAAATAAAMWITRGWWWGPTLSIATVAVIIIVTGMAGYFAGMIDFSGQNPLWLLAGVLRCWSHAAFSPRVTCAARAVPTACPTRYTWRASTADSAHRPDPDDSPTAPDPDHDSVTVPPSLGDDTDHHPHPDQGDRQHPRPQHPRPAATTQPPPDHTRRTGLEAFLAAAGKHPAPRQAEAPKEEKGSHDANRA